MKLLPKQNNAVYFLRDPEVNETLYGGAAGGGKSAFGCIWLIEMCQKYPGTRWVMGREVLKTLKETTLNTFFEVSKKLDVNDQWEYKKQSGVIQWTNGSQILLKELKQKPTDLEFDALGSLEITGAFVDEVAQIVLKAWTTLKSRIRYKLKDFCGECGCPKKVRVIQFKEFEGQRIANKWVCSNGHTTTGISPNLLGSCNPSKNWSYKLFYRPWRKGELPSNRAFIQSLPRDNPFLPDSYLKTLDELDPISRARLRDGSWEYDNDKSALIGYDSIMNYWNGQHIKITGEEEMYLTIDVARKGKDKTVFRIWRGWNCIKRYEMKISKTTEVVHKARNIQKAFKIKNSNTIADEDGVGGGVVDHLGCKGFINNSKPLRDPKAKDGDMNYNNLKSQCSVRMAKRIASGDVSEVCEDPEVIELVSEEMEQVKLKDIEKDGKSCIVSKGTIKSMIGRSPDDWDSIMMREWFTIGKIKHKVF